jgi:hypothetical protein
MTVAHWLQVLSRITGDQPLDLDVLVFPDAPAADPASPRHLPPRDAGTLPPPAALWPLGEDAASCIGVRVTGAVPDLPGTAMRLASAAIERKVIPIILSHIGQSGFEQYGFRVERIHASAPGDIVRQEAEIAAFWDLAIIVDADSVGELH